MSDLDDCSCEPRVINCLTCSAINDAEDLLDARDAALEINEDDPAEPVKKKAKGRASGTVNWTHVLHMDMLESIWSGPCPDSFDTPVSSPEFRVFAVSFLDKHRLNFSVGNLHAHIVEMIKQINGAVSQLSSQAPPVLKPPTSTLR